MKLQLNNVWTQIVESTPQERLWCRSFLKITDDTAYWANRGRHMSVYDILNDQFASGFLPLMKKAARQDGVEITCEDMRVRPCEFDAELLERWCRDGMGPELHIPHDYQRDFMLRGNRYTRGILRAVTGSGKGTVAAMLPMLFPCRWLFVVHRTGIAVDTAERFEALSGETAGRIAGGGAGSVGRFTVATFQSLMRSQNKASFRTFMESRQGICVDECHTLGAGGFMSVSLTTPNAYFRFGMSGTPLDRTDKKSALGIGITGPILVEATTRELADAGIIARPITHLVPCWQTSEKPTYRGYYGELVTRSKAWHRALLWCWEEVWRLNRVPAIIFVRALKHGHAIVKDFQKRGINCEFLHGEKKQSQRDATLRDLADGRLDVIVANEVLQEGANVPSIRAVINAACGASKIAALQRPGRGMRAKADGPNECHLYDIHAQGHRRLEEHSRKRLAAYRRENHEIIWEDPSLDDEVLL